MEYCTVDNARRVEAAEATTTETTTRHGMSSSRRATRQRSIIETLAQVRIYDKRNEAGYKLLTELSAHRRSSEPCNNTRRDKSRNTIVRDVNKKTNRRAAKSELETRWSGSVTIEKLQAQFFSSCATNRECSPRIIEPRGCTTVTGQ